MTEDNQRTQGETISQREHQVKKARLLGVVYRVVLASGLLTLIAVLALLIFTRQMIVVMLLLLPAALIAVGIILAWVEYRLDLRLQHDQVQAPTNGEDTLI
jgi:L-asparagine transporter-like permease